MGNKTSVPPPPSIPHVDYNTPIQDLRDRVTAIENTLDKIQQQIDHQQTTASPPRQPSGQTRAQSITKQESSGLKKKIQVIRDPVNTKKKGPLIQSIQQQLDQMNVGIELIDMTDNPDKADTEAPTVYMMTTLTGRTAEESRNEELFEKVLGEKGSLKTGQGKGGRFTNAIPMIIYNGKVPSAFNMWWDKPVSLLESENKLIDANQNREQLRKMMEYLKLSES